MKKIDGRLDLDNYIKDCCNLIIGDEDQALFHIRCKESTDELHVGLSGNIEIGALGLASMMFQSEEVYELISMAVEYYNDIDENNTISTDVTDN